MTDNRDTTPESHQVDHVAPEVGDVDHFNVVFQVIPLGDTPAGRRLVEDSVIVFRMPRIGHGDGRSGQGMTTAKENLITPG